MQPNKVSHPYLGGCFKFFPAADWVSAVGVGVGAGLFQSRYFPWLNSLSRYIIYSDFLREAYTESTANFQCFRAGPDLFQHCRGENGPFGPDLLGGAPGDFRTWCVLKV